DEGRQALAHERKRHLRADKATPTGDPPMVEAPAVRHEHPPWCEGTSQVGQCVVRHVVEDEVVTLPRPREVLFGVIDDMVCAERPDQAYVSRARDAGHLRSERLRDLNREGSDATRGPDDQDLLPGFDLAATAQRLE